MKIKILYDDKPTYLEVEDDDCTVMIDADYEDRISSADTGEVVGRRSLQEIIDERFNKPEYNNWHKFDRHYGMPKKPFRKDDEADDESDHMDFFADNSDEDKRNLHYEYDDWCDRIRRSMKPAYAEMIIAIHLDGLSVQEYAECIGDKPNNVSHRLKRAEKIFRETFPKTSFSASSQGYQLGGKSSKSKTGGNSDE